LLLLHIWLMLGNPNRRVNFLGRLCLDDSRLIQRLNRLTQPLLTAQIVKRQRDERLIRVERLVNELVQRPRPHEVLIVLVRALCRVYPHEIPASLELTHCVADHLPVLKHCRLLQDLVQLRASADVRLGVGEVGT